MAQKRLVEIVLQGKDQTKSAFDSLGLNLDSGKMKALAFAGAAAAVATGFAKAVDALYDFTSEMAALGDEMEKMSARTGVVVEELSALDFAVARGGGTTADLETAVRRLARSMGDARDNVKEAKDAFAQLGLTTGDLVGPNGDLLEIQDILPLIADGLKDIDSQATRMDIAQSILGRGGTRLLPALQEGREGLAQLREEMERYGGVMTTEFADKSAEFVDSQTNLASATQRLKEALSEPFLAPFTAAVNKLAKAVADSAEAADLLINGVPDPGPGGSPGEFTSGGDALTREGMEARPGSPLRIMGPTIRAPRGPRSTFAPWEWDMSGSMMDPRYINQTRPGRMGMMDIPAGDLMSGWDSSLFGPMDPDEVNQDWFVGLNDGLEELDTVLKEAENTTSAFGDQFGAAIGTGLARALVSAENFGDAFVMILQSFFEQALASVGSSVFGSIFGAVGGAILPGAGGAFSEIGGKAMVASAGTKALPSPITMAGIGAGYSAAQAANAKVYV